MQARTRDAGRLPPDDKGLPVCGIGAARRSTLCRAGCIGFTRALVLVSRRSSARHLRGPVDPCARRRRVASAAQFAPGGAPGRCARRASPKTKSWSGAAPSSARFDSIASTSSIPPSRPRTRPCSGSPTPSISSPANRPWCRSCCFARATATTRSSSRRPSASLRSNDYLRDARIVPVAYHDGTVDLEVTTEDTWTLKPEIKFGRSGGKNTSGIGIEEKKHLRHRRPPRPEGDIGRRPHVAFHRVRRLELRRHALAGRRPGRQQQRRPRAGPRRGAAVLLARHPMGRRHPPAQRATDRFGLRLRQHRRAVPDATSARPPLPPAGRPARSDGWTTRWTSGVTFDERRSGSLMSDNPGAVLPPDRRLLYPWVGAELIEDDFRLTRNHDQIGRTEDVRFGWYARIRLGASTKALGSDRNALVFDGSASKTVEPGRGANAVLERGGDGPPRRARAGEHLVQRRRALLLAAGAVANAVRRRSAPTAASTSTSTSSSRSAATTACAAIRCATARARVAGC